MRRGEHARPTVALVQLGCDKNTVDGERLLGELTAAGYTAVTPALGRRAFTPASVKRRIGFVSPDGQSHPSVDLLLINTCGFIAPARAESLAAIRAGLALKRRGEARRLAVCGCDARRLSEERNWPEREGIDFFFGPGDIARVARIAEGAATPWRAPAGSLDPGPRLLSRPPATAFVKISEGCDRGCAFCAIPALRGRMVSRPERRILDEIAGLLDLGAKEIVLVAQDLTGWGRDRDRTLAHLVRRIDRLPSARGFRLRLLYLFPALVTDELLDAIAASPVTAPYFDMPVQHASPAVLRRMRRPGSDLRFLRLIDRIRTRFAECAIRSTVITGHPGETAREFRRLLGFLAAAQFDRLGVFPYCPEPGTPSARLRAPAGADERAAEVMALQREISRQRLARRVGRTYDVLMDTNTAGRSALEAPDVDGVIRVSAPAGALVPVRITHADCHDLVGKLAGDAR